MSLRKDLHDIAALGGISVKELLKQLYKKISEDQVFDYAAVLAYYFFFSIFPFFIFLTALLPYIPVPDILNQIMSVLDRFIPKEALDIVQDNVENLVSTQRSGLLSFGIILSLWSASSAMSAIGDCLNQAYDVKESRPYWKVRGKAILLTIGFAFLLIISISLLIFGPMLIELLASHFGAGSVLNVILAIIRWILIVFFMIFTVALIYYFTPDVEQQWRWITPGSVIAVIVWLCISLLFSYYVDNFGSYDKTYGSLGAVIILLTWMYFSGLFLLIGGEINAVIEHNAENGKDKGGKKI